MVRPPNYNIGEAKINGGYDVEADEDEEDVFPHDFLCSFKSMYKNILGKGRMSLRHREIF